MGNFWRLPLVKILMLSNIVKLHIVGQQILC